MYVESEPGTYRYMLTNDLGWLDQREDGWMNGWRCVDGYAWMGDGLGGIWMDEKICGWIDGKMAGRIAGQMGG